MSKVIKKIGKTLLHSLSSVVLLAILLILAVAMAMSLPRVQSFVADKATEWLNKECGVNISIGTISLEHITTLTAEEVYVEDLAGDTLLWVSKLSGKIDRRALLDEGRFIPYNAKVKGAKFYLVEGKNGKKNNLDLLIEHIESHFPAKKTENTTAFAIENVEAEDFRFRLYNEALAGSVPEGSIDYSDMDIMVSSATFGKIEVAGRDVILTNVENINAVDKSKAHLYNSRMGRLLVGFGLLDFKDIDFYSGGSHLVLPSLVLSAPDWEDYKDFYNKVTLSLTTIGSSIEPISGDSFVPALGDIQLQGVGITGTFVGTVNDFTTDLSTTLYDSKVDVKGSVKNLLDFDKLTAEATVDIDTTPAKVGTIYRNILNEELPAEAKEWLERFATLSLVGTASLSPNQVVADAELGTNKGSITVDGRLNYGPSLIAFDGRISGDGLQAGEILQLEQLGKADLTLAGAVEMKDGALGGQLKADVARIGWGNYDYNNIELQASLQGKEFRASAISTDPNITFSLESDGIIDEKEPEYNLILSLDRADIGTLGLVKNDSSAWLAGSVEATLTGRSLDDMVGRAMINNLIYATDTDTLSTELMNISLRGGEQDKSFSLRSNIADVEYRSTAPYEDVFAYLSQRVPTQLPWAKPTENQQEPQEPRTPLGDRLYMADDYTSVSLKIFDGENLASVFMPEGNISSGSSLTLEFSPSAEEFVLQVESNRIEAKELVISDLDIMVNGHGQRMDLRAESSELKTAGLVIPDLTFRAASNENHEVDANLYFSDTDTAVSGQLGAYAQLAYDDKGAFTASTKLHDSYIISPNQQWTIEATQIDYSTEGVAIDNFVVQSADSSLGINGNINKKEDEPLTLSLRNIAVDEWVALLTGLKDVHGRLNGEVELYSALQQPYGNGSLNITSLSMGGIDVEPMLFSVAIPRKSTTANASLTNTISHNTLARGKYNYTDNTFEAKLTIDDFHFSLLEPMLKGVVHDLNGTGDIDVELSSSGNAALDIRGSVKASELATTVDFTGARYTIPALKLTFDDNKGVIAPFRLEDSEGGWADVKATANLKNLEAITYEASVEPHNLIAINQPQEANAPFYGKVYVVDGGVKISGSDTSTSISGGVNTGNGSVFSIPLTGNSDFAGADFVTFVSHKQESEAGNNGTQRKDKESAKTPSNLSVDMMLGVDTNTLLRLIIDPETENVIEAKGDANLAITLDARKNDFAIRGDYQITEGVYNFNFQNIITKKFDINPGSYIRWNGSPLDANIDVAATYKLKTSLAPLLGTESTASRASTPVECIVKLTGSLAKVDVSFDINVPTANTEYQSILSSYFSSQEMMATQFVYLLALGNFYSDSSSGQNTTAGAAGTAIGLDFLASQVSRLVSNDTYKFNLKYKAIDDTSSSYSIDFQTELIDDRLTLELEANVDTGDYFETIGNNNQLSGGGSITLRLDPQGSLYLKGFSRTIDRFDENQGLQENGIGLYFQRSFNTFNELLSKKKSSPTKAENEKSGNFAPSDSSTPEGESNEDGSAE